MQAYGKRALDVIDWAAAAARTYGRRMTVRLVKGAYWDSEIKRAQERGLDGYPVYTRKVTTDVSYLACVGRLFSHADVIYPQFATHNAHSIASVLELAPAGADYEFQRLHGMGRLLYAEAARQIANFPRVRVYAPVGEHKDLLAYLVRRLLENGANTSFVNRFMDEEVPVAEIVRDPISEIERLESYAHPRLAVPAALYPDRRNSRGIDLGNPPEIEHAARGVIAAPAQAARRADHRRDIAAGKHASGLQPGGSARPGGRHARRDSRRNSERIRCGRRGAAGVELDGRRDSRASCLDKASDLLEASRADFHELLVREAGKTISDAIAEVREAVDFCRYYAVQAREQFAAPQRLQGPTGESNELSLHGRGVFACISPWNFPLAIFAGQVTAALAAGNTVVAKPAEPTPLIAARFVKLLHEAGVPPQAVHLVPARGRLFGEAAFAHAALAGVAMTGSTATALTDQSQLGGAQRRDRAIDRRDRRVECDDRRLDGSARASRR